MTDLPPLPSGGMMMPTQPIPLPMTHKMLRHSIETIDPTLAETIGPVTDENAWVQTWTVINKNGRKKVVCTLVDAVSDLERYAGPLISEAMYLYDISYRRALAYTLSEMGYPQVDIAAHMLVTQGTVSQMIAAASRKIARLGRERGALREAKE